MLDKQVVHHAQFPEIRDGAQMDVGRVVPCIGQKLVARHLAAEQELQAGFEQTKVREAYNGVIANAQHFLEHLLGMQRLLECLAQDNHVKAAVPVKTHPLEHIAVIYRHAVMDCLADIQLVNLYPADDAVFVSRQVRKQLAIAAPQIEYAASLGNKSSDEFVIGPAALPRTVRICRHRLSTLSCSGMNTLIYIIHKIAHGL